jgi:hypothetical protein
MADFAIRWIDLKLADPSDRPGQSLYFELKFNGAIFITAFLWQPFAVYVFSMNLLQVFPDILKYICII